VYLYTKNIRPGIIACEESSSHSNRAFVKKSSPKISANGRTQSRQQKEMKNRPRLDAEASVGLCTLPPNTHLESIDYLLAPFLLSDSLVNER
jgi:hypothetical protein